MPYRCSDIPTQIFNIILYNEEDFIKYQGLSGIQIPFSHSDFNNLITPALQNKCNDIVAWISILSEIERLHLQYANESWVIEDKTFMLYQWSLDSYNVNLVGTSGPAEINIKDRIVVSGVSDIKESADVKIKVIVILKFR
jgi:hypothetical protein